MSFKLRRLSSRIYISCFNLEILFRCFVSLRVNYVLYIALTLTDYLRWLVDVHCMIIRYCRRYCMLWGRMGGVSRLLLFVWTHGCTFRRSWGLSILPFCILERTNDVKLERSSYVLVCVIYSTTHKIILLIGRSLFVVWGFNDDAVLCLICQWTRCLYWCCCCCFWFAVVVKSVCVSYCRCFFHFSISVAIGRAILFM